MRDARFSETLLRSWPSAEKVYLIDANELQADDVDPADAEQEVQDSITGSARKLMRRFQRENGTRVELVKGYSVAKAAMFADGAIDFVYLDARHDYCAVREDMEAYWTKVACGGVMAGHDYMSADEVHIVSRRCASERINT